MRKRRETQTTGLVVCIPLYLYIHIFCVFVYMSVCLCVCRVCFVCLCICVLCSHMFVYVCVCVVLYVVSIIFLCFLCEAVRNYSHFHHKQASVHSTSFLRVRSLASSPPYALLQMGQECPIEAATQRPWHTLDEWASLRYLETGVLWAHSSEGCRESRASKWAETQPRRQKRQRVTEQQPGHPDTPAALHLPDSILKTPFSDKSQQLLLSWGWPKPTSIFIYFCFVF